MNGRAAARRSCCILGPRAASAPASSDESPFLLLRPSPPIKHKRTQLAWWGVAFWGAVFYTAFGGKKKQAPAAEPTAEAA